MTAQKTAARETRLFTKGYVIRSMERLNLPRHPIILMLITSRQKNNASVKELRLDENSVTNSHELSNAFNDHFSTIGTMLICY